MERVTSPCTPLSRNGAPIASTSPTATYGDETLAALADAAAEEAACVEVLDADKRARFVPVVVEGDRQQFADQRWRRELVSWMHPRRKGDRLAYSKLAVPVTRFVVRHFDVGKGTAGRDAELARPLTGPCRHRHRRRPRPGLAARRASPPAHASHGCRSRPSGLLRQPADPGGGAPPRVGELLARPDFGQIGLRLGRPAEQLPAAPRRAAPSTTLSSRPEERPAAAGVPHVALGDHPARPHPNN